MNYTIFLTQQSNQLWQANVPTLPNCFVEAPSRLTALERIQKRIVSIVTHSEVLNLTLHNERGNVAVEMSETPWELFGSGKSDTSLPTLFDGIEGEWSMHMIGG
ncbi:MAG: hypothetical protein ACPG8W_03510 [Candidatus Promineifilaceae bacterium]